MTEPAKWVIGRGLLGRAIERHAASSPLHVPIAWANSERALSDLIAGADEFGRFDGPLEVFWSAGRGVTSTPAPELDREVELFARAIDEFGARWKGRDVRFFLASSVGGAYALASPPPFNEHTPVAPGSPYGIAKLQMESICADASRRFGWRSFIARITNLYGPGQDMAKGQGIISVITDSFVSGRPVSLYVSLDTLRDYIYEDDCARVIHAGVERLTSVDSGRTVIKIVGSMAAVSIGAILGETTRLRRQRSRIVLGSGSSTGQASDLRVRSVVWPELDGLVRTSLPEGLDQVFRARLSAFAEGNR